MIMTCFQFKDDNDCWQMVDDDGHAPLEKAIQKYTDTGDEPQIEMWFYGWERRRKKYYIHFHYMKSTNVQTKKERRLRRGDGMIVFTKGGSQPTLKAAVAQLQKHSSWQVWLNHGWFNMPEDESKHLFNCVANGTQTTEFTHHYKDPRLKRVCTTEYTFDINECTQKNNTSSTTRDIRFFKCYEIETDAATWWYNDNYQQHSAVISVRIHWK